MVHIFSNGLWKSGNHLSGRALELGGLAHTRLNLGSHSRQGRGSILKKIIRSSSQSTINVGLEIDAWVDQSWLRSKLKAARRFPNGIIGGHVGYSKALSDELCGAGWRTLLIVRHPVEVVSSFCRWVDSDRAYYLRPYFREKGPDTVAQMLLEGFSTKWGHFRSFGDITQLMVGWAADPNTLVVKFEDLVGPEGGGTATLQIRALEAIAEMANFQTSDLFSIRDKLFGNTKTFRRGRVTGGESELSAECRAEVMRATENFRLMYKYT